MTRYLARVLFVLALLAPVLYAVDAQAINLGPVVVQPNLEFAAIHDDNIFVVHPVPGTPKTPDWYFKITPGILLRMTPRDNLLELEYSANFLRYVNTGDRNNTTDQNVRGAVHLKFPRGLTLKIDDTLTKGHEPRSEQSLGTSGPLNRFLSNTAKIEGGLKFTERLNVGLYYSHFHVNYTPAEINFRDRNDNSASAIVSYGIFPKTSVVLQGIYTDVTHLRHPGSVGGVLNSNEWWAMAGIVWDITEKSTGTIKGGYEWKNFRSPGRADFRSPIYQVAIDHKFTAKTSVNISGARRANETDDPAVSYYTSTSGAITLTFKPINKVSVKPAFIYTVNRYSGPTVAPDGQAGRRQDRIWSPGVEAVYDINKWVKVSGGYTYTERLSSLKFYQYRDNTFLIKLNASI